MVPTYERHDAWEGRAIQDWRWSVGAVPWGPHAHSHQLSGVLVAAAKRNFVISHVELAIKAVNKRLLKVWGRVWMCGEGKGKRGKEVGESAAFQLAMWS